MIIMLICLIFSFFCLIDNYSAGKEQEWDEGHDGHPIISGTIEAHGKDQPSEF